MVMNRSIVWGFLAAMTLANALAAAELPTQDRKPKAPQAAKHCNIAGSPGAQAANGVCVRLSGYISGGFSAEHVK